MVIFDKVSTVVTLKWAEALNGFCLLKLFVQISHGRGGVPVIISQKEG